MAGKIDVDFQKDTAKLHEKKEKIKKTNKKRKRKNSIDELIWLKDRTRFNPLKKENGIDFHKKLEHLEGKTPYETWSELYTPEIVGMITGNLPNVP